MNATRLRAAPARLRGWWAPSRQKWIAPRRLRAPGSWPRPSERADNRALFRRFQERWRSGPELLQQRRLVGLRRRQMPRLDGSESSDFFRNRRKPDRTRMIARRQLRQHLIEHRFVIGDELALCHPLFRVAEDIERRATQEFQ